MRLRPSFTRFKAFSSHPSTPDGSLHICAEGSGISTMYGGSGLRMDVSAEMEMRLR